MYFKMLISSCLQMNSDSEQKCEEKSSLIKKFSECLKSKSWDEKMKKIVDDLQQINVDTLNIIESIKATSNTQKLYIESIKSQLDTLDLIDNDAKQSNNGEYQLKHIAGMETAFNLLMSFYEENEKIFDNQKKLLNMQIEAIKQREEIVKKQLKLDKKSADTLFGFLKENCFSFGFAGGILGGGILGGLMGLIPFYTGFLGAAGTAVIGCFTICSPLIFVIPALVGILLGIIIQFVIIFFRKKKKQKKENDKLESSKVLEKDKNQSLCEQNSKVLNEYEQNFFKLQNLLVNVVKITGKIETDQNNLKFSIIEMKGFLNCEFQRKSFTPEKIKTMVDRCNELEKHLDEI